MARKRPTDRRFDLAGRAALAATGMDERDLHALGRQLDPFAAGNGASGDVELRRAATARPPAGAERHHAAGDGTTTAWSGEALHLLAGERWCRLPDLLAAGPLRFELEPGLALERVFGRLLRPALALALLRRGHVAAHGTGVELDGGGILVAGWSESGKTETALALMERGARFLSDKWTVVGADASLSAFPIGAGVRRWVLPYLPRLRAGLPRAVRAQFALAAAADAGSRPLRGGRARGRAGALASEAAGRAVALADRAALSPSRLRAAYGQTDDPARHVPVRCVALLVNVDGDAVTVEPADPGWAARRLARSAAYERRPWFALHERARYSAPERPAGDEQLEAVVEHERALLEPLLAATPVMTIRAPFPTDPRRAADALARALG